MTPQISTIPAKTLIGMSTEMSLTDNKTFRLFSLFMPRRKELSTLVDEQVYDLRVYPEGYYQPFSPANTFTKWAAVEVSGTDTIPEGMKSFSLPAGEYAIFHLKGSIKDNSPFQYIFSQWLPNSGYQLDNRPHFDMMSTLQKRDSPEFEQKIFIPIKK